MIQPRCRLGRGLLLAQMRSADRLRKCLQLGVDRTDRGHYETAAFDPNRTWLRSLADALAGRHDGGEAALGHSGSPASRSPRLISSRVSLSRVITQSPAFDRRMAGTTLTRFLQA